MPSTQLNNELRIDLTFEEIKRIYMKAAEREPSDMIQIRVTQSIVEPEEFLSRIYAYFYGEQPDEEFAL